MGDWLRSWLEEAQREVARGNVAFVQCRIVPFAVLAGVVLGVLVALFSSVVACLVLIGLGGLIGYAARSYVSHRRRLAYLNRHGLGSEP